MVKDPRISLLMPLWDRLALQALPAVMAVRDPREVVGSLDLRNGMPPRRALALWIVYVIEALRGAHGRPLLVVDYGSLLAQPAHAVSTLSEFIVRTCDVETPAPSLESLVALVESDLNRNRGAGAFGISEVELADAMDIYRYVMKAHLEPDVDVEAPAIPDWVRDAVSDARDIWAAQQAAASAGQVIEELEYELRAAAQSAEEITAAVADLAILQEQRESLSLRLGELQALLESEREVNETSERRRLAAESRAIEVVAAVEQRTREISVLEQELGRTREQLAAAEEQLGQLRLSTSGVTDQVRNLEAEVAIKVADLTEMEAQAASLRAIHVEHADAWARERRALTQQTEESLRASEVLAAELQRARVDAQRAGERVSAAESELESLRQSAKQEMLSFDQGRRDLENRLAVREGEVAELRIRAASAAAQVQASTSEVAMLQRLLDDSHGQRSHDVIAWERERDDLGRRVEESSSAAAVLSAELKRARLSLAEGQQTMDALQLDLEVREADIGHLAEQLQSAVVDRDRAVSQVAVLEQTVADVRAQHDHESASLRSECASLAQEREASAEGLLRAQREVQSLETMRRRHDGLTTALTEQLARKSGLVGSLTARLSEAEDGIVVERDRANGAEEHSVMLEQQVLVMAKQLDMETSRYARLMEALSAAIGEGQSLLAEVDGLKASRSYRYGRALTALGRALVGGPAVPPRIPARYVVPGVDASEVSRMIAAGTFDAGWYLTTYQDVVESGVDPLFHYLTQGRLEGRLPGPRAPFSSDTD
jgi:chromosome segregation ATPase